MNAQEKARLKLAGTYLLIIMAMSLIFSFVLYNGAEHELRGQRKVPLPQQVRLPFLDDFDKLREDRLTQGRHELQLRLIRFNMITLLIGAGVSYVLARQALRPIEETIESQARFTSDASHELRTPLTAMRSEIEVALRDPKLSGKHAREVLESNLEEVTKLEALTGGLLQLARQENNRELLDPIALQQIITDAIDRVERQANEKNILIEFTEKTEAIVRADSPALTQLLVILLDNAIKYSPEKSSIKIAVESDKDRAHISVTDKGIGIESNDLVHVFERFYRSDKARSGGERSGYGLGLAIAKQIADMHRGSISLESAPGAGTTATASIPLAKS